MPRNISLRKTFSEQYGAKAQAKTKDKPGAKAKKPPKKPVTIREVTSTRYIRTEIAAAAQAHHYITLRYKKTTTGEIKRYIVAPYSYRFMKSKKTNKRRKALYAYDSDDKHIKCFYTKNIKGVENMTKRFRPKWVVEIGVDN
jgi:predicted DNA-binding transcriptional regulator YafY